MLIKCDWCGKFIGTRPPFGGKYDDTKEATSGICDNCLTRYFPHEAEKVNRVMGGQRRY